MAAIGNPAMNQDAGTHQSKKSADVAKVASGEREEFRVFHDHIKRSGLKRTAQRDLILDVFLRTDDHVSSEDLYELVKAEDPTIGFTTVYRTLRLLADVGAKVLPLFLDHYAAIIWEDQDECLEVRPEDIEL